jgi:hypothetical protein
MDMPLTADDVVVGILHQLRKETPNLRITADREKIHSAFMKLLDAGCDAVRSVFNFRQREVFAESAELDQALSNLDAAGIISRYNQAPKYYTVGDSLDVCYETFSKKTLEAAGISETFLAKEAKQISLSLENAAA